MDFHDFHGFCSVSGGQDVNGITGGAVGPIRTSEHRRLHLRIARGWKSGLQTPGCRSLRALLERLWNDGLVMVDWIDRWMVDW